MTPSQDFDSTAPTEAADRSVERKCSTRALVDVAPNSAQRRGMETGSEMHRELRHTRLPLKLAASQSGLGTIEFALVAGILSTLVLGALDFGVGFWEQIEVGNAARAGA